MIKEIVTNNKDITEQIKIDMILSMITLKYTQSISVCFALNGQIIGVGSGQQSRIHCTRLAASKADTWYLRQHPTVLNLPFKEGLSSPEKDNGIDQFLIEDVTEIEMKEWRKLFTKVPEKLSKKEKTRWLSNLTGVTLGSDAFIPFRDNIDRAARSGVRFITQPGGSLKDDAVIEACNEYGITMAFSKTRLFHH